MPKLHQYKNILFRTAVLITANFAAALFGFAVISLIARKFGPAGLGEYTLATTIIIYANLLASFGTEIYGVTSTSSKKFTLETMIGRIVPIRIMLSGATLLGIIALVSVVPQYSSIFYLAIFFGFTVFSYSLILTWVPQALHKSGIIAIVNIALQASYFIGLYIAFIFNADIIFAPAVKLFTEVLIAIALFFWIKKQIGKKIKYPKYTEIIDTLKECIPIGSAQLIRGLSISSDIILLGLFVANEAIGMYSSAHKIFLLFISSGSAYFLILLPRISNLSDNLVAIKNELTSSIHHVFPILLIGLAVVFVFSTYFLTLLFGSEYEEASVILRLFCITIFINIWSRHYRQVMLVLNYKHEDFRMSRISCIIHVISKSILIPLLGPIGCAIGTMLGELYLLIVQRKFVLAKLKSV